MTKNIVAWQIWNEMNHQPSSFVNNDIQTVCSIFTIAGETIRDKSASTAPRYVNVMADEPIDSKIIGIQKWEEAVEKWLAPTCAGRIIDGVGIDHYPGTWTLNPAFAEWSPLEKLLLRVNNASDTLFFRKLPAIMETGFSTWASHIANEDDQLRWVQESLPAVREIIHRDGPIHYFCFYELTQGPPKKKVEFPPEECCFGITYANFTKKKAFNALSEQLLLMNKQV